MNFKRPEDLTLPSIHSIPPLPPFPSKIHLSDQTLEIPLTLPSIRAPLMKNQQALPSLKSLGLIVGNSPSSISQTYSPTYPSNFPQTIPQRQEFRFIHHRQHQDNFRPYYHNHRFRLSPKNPDVSSSTKVKKKF
ncbi:9886_t:CDS:1 [Funneliformis geosporum]|uniref:3931_t:CDS:1 n=1 Tax=Funneliformis geosporum TaxID=1117311 RepID=A0A9W4SSS1_9GLOM|nr:9886_t:CDS:1 [Funneliformis geosporum]CAI2179522.1 3931_t:CDS:1 [Funneliformis geosporum]